MAMDPRWYLNTHHKPVEIDPLPFESEVQEKYQMAAAAQMMNWVQPMTKALIHRYPNNE